MGIETKINWTRRLNSCTVCTLSGCPIRRIGKIQQEEVLEAFKKGTLSSETIFPKIYTEIFNSGATSRGGPLFIRKAEHEKVETTIHCPERYCPVGSKTAKITSIIHR